MPFIAVVNDSKTADDAEIEFAVKACDEQLRRDFCPAWPHAQYQPVEFFSSAAGLPTGSGVALICSIVDELDSPTAAAYHSFVGVPIIKIGTKFGPLAPLISHELIEEVSDPTCVLTRIGDDMVIRALEPCDPVEAWTYDIETTVSGETRPVPVSAFVYERWFTNNDVGPTYFCPGRSDDLAPLELAPGGYIPFVSHGIWDNLFADNVGLEGQIEKSLKHASNVTSRASRRKI